MSEYSTNEETALLSKPDTKLDIKSYDALLLQKDGYAWDYAIVFPNVPLDKPMEGLSHVLPKLHEAVPHVDLSSLPHLYAAQTKIAHGINAAQETITTGITTGITTVLDVFRTNEEHLSIEDICHRIHKSGLELRLFYSSHDSSSKQAPYILCQIRAPFALLKHEADRIDIQKLMDKDKLKEQAMRGYREYNIAPFPIEDTLKQYRLSPYQYIHMTYTERADMQDLYAHTATGLLFSGCERILLIESILTNSTGGGAGLDLIKLEASETIVAAFPLHNEREKVRLAEAWLHRKLMFRQPIAEIEAYFGPKVALYFAFLGHYAHWLLSAGIIGSLISVLQMINNIAIFGWNISLGSHWFQAMICTFSIFMVLWSTTMLEHWKRFNARLAMQWGTTDYTEEERPRPQFIGTLIPSPITGKFILYFDRKEQRRRKVISWLVLFLIVLMVLVLVSFTFYLRFYMAIEHKETFVININNGTKLYYGGIAASLGNVIQIAIMAEIYDRVCMRMNDYENHATESAHEEAFILKSIIFHFVNNFAALFYITFIKSTSGFEDACENRNCLQELRTTLIIIFGTQLIAGNIQEVLLPRLFIWIAKCQSGTAINKTVSKVESEFFLIDYGWRGTFNDYLELVLQFGFTVLFVGAFPATPMFSLLNNVLEIRIDAYRLLTDYRRPTPRPVVDMGAWVTVLDILATMAIVTNGYVMVYTSGVFDSLGSTEEEGAYYRLMLFLTFFTLMLFVRYVIWAVMKNNYSVEVRAQLKRQSFLSSKVYTREADDVVPEYAHDANYQALVIIAIITNCWVIFFTYEYAFILSKYFSSHGIKITMDLSYLELLLFIISVAILLIIRASVAKYINDVPAEKIMLLDSIITNVVGFNVENLKSEQSNLDCFSLHNIQELKELKNNWNLWNLCSQSKEPIEEIIIYYGTKVVMYFAYLNFYTIFLLVAGFVVFIFDQFINVDTFQFITHFNEIGSKRQVVEVYTIPIFGVFMALWATIFLEGWKRSGSIYALKWRTSNHHEIERPRFQFKGMPKNWNNNQTF
ncbi:anoctamin [Thraustotheca clavata]|uniref:Anoctamin n=1 Tax=Thraustotheca clavata TaxID=74557 RepID=A0A1V9ZC95_9STRA|nr:anoctamin [Thraustotheca clavata]